MWRKSGLFLLKNFKQSAALLLQVSPPLNFKMKLKLLNNHENSKIFRIPKNKFFRDKKADSPLLNIIFQLLAVAFILVSLIFFINTSSKREFIEQKNLVKTLALAIDESPSGATIEVLSNSEIALDPANQNISVGKYSYSFFRKNVDFESGVWQSEKGGRIYKITAR